MKGFEIIINGVKQHFGIQKGNIFILLHNQSKKEISISGENDIRGLSLDWDKIPLNIGDHIKITATEVEESVLPSSEKQRDRQTLLTQYNDIKEFLKREGVIK